MSGHPHDHHDSSGNLEVAFFLNFGFTILEFFGGLWTNSIAILTDSVHDLGDSVSLGLAWYFDRLSRRGRTPRHTYGYRRYRLLGGLITGVLLLVGLGFVLYHAVSRLADPQEVNTPGMMALALLGVLFNGAAVLRLKKGRSLTEKLVTWHLLEDTLGWLAVLVGAGIIAIWKVPIVDPILSIGISFLVLWNVGRNLRQVLLVLLQAAPEGFEADAFERRALQIEGVDSLHHIHSWSIDGESHVLSAHVVLRSEAENAAAIKRMVRELVDPGTFEHITIETEFRGEPCPQDDKRSGVPPGAA